MRLLAFIVWIALANSLIAVGGIGGDSTNGSTQVSAVIGSSTALNAGQTYTSDAVDASAFDSLIVVVKTDQAGSLYVDFSVDGTNWDSTLTYSVAASTNEIHRLVISRKYVRVRFMNTSASNQTYFRLQLSMGSKGILNSPLNSTIQGDADALIVRPSFTQLDLTRGLISGSSTVNKFGQNPDIDAGQTEDIWGVGGTFTPPTSAGTVSFVSSSANDASAGTGARTLTVFGLDGNYDAASETITLNGTTPVATANSYFIIHRALVETGGSGGTNAGAITGTSNGGGAPTMITVLAGKGQSQFGIYQVPAGYTAYIDIWDGGISGGTTGTVELFIKPFGGVFNLKGSLQLNAAGTSNTGRALFFPIQVTEKSVIKLVGTAVSNNTVVYGNFDLVLIQN